jgi:SNF2 family DNA or RNA helicase
MSRIIIDTDNSGSSQFVLSGDVQNAVNDRRLLLSLKRLRYTYDDGRLLIPHRAENSIAVLQEIEVLLSKFGFEIVRSENIQQDYSNYDREVALFDEFSHKAFSIRNNEFENYPDLVSDFDQFQKVVKSQLIRTLYPLQLLSSFHMAFAQNACNFAVPGAGKTSIVYGAYAYLKSLPHDDLRHIDKLMVIGPLSSFAPWENEYEACFGHKASFQRLSGDTSISKDDKLQHLFSGNPSEVTLIFHGGVPLLQKEIIDFLKRHKTMVVVDEAHRIKNPEGVWGRSITDISKEAVARAVLTGTPVPNGYEDIYNLYKFIYPFKYKDILGFHFQNLQDLTKGGNYESPRVQTLKDNISPFFIRIKKGDLYLPPIKETIIPISMGEFQREIYDYIENEYIDSFRSNPSATVKDILNRAKLIRLRQASTNPTLLLKPIIGSLEDCRWGEEWDADPNAKILSYGDETFDDSEFFLKIKNYPQNEIPKKFEGILDIIETEIVPRSEKVIVWTIFIQNAKDLQRFLKDKGIYSELLIGEVPPYERENIIRSFNNPDNHDFNVVIANPFAVAESISLHKGCHNAIYLERDYNASNFIQSKDRIHRVGLSPDVVTNYYYVVSENSVDEIINRRLDEKVKRMENIINDDIPLFDRINDLDETDIIKDLINSYAQRTTQI